MTDGESFPACLRRETRRDRDFLIGIMAHSARNDRAVTEPAEKFLDAAVRGFGDNAELQVIARRELEEMLDPAAQDAATEAAKRFDAVDCNAHPRLKRYFAGVVAAVSLLIAGWTAWGIYQDWDELQGFDGHWGDQVAIDWIRTLPPADQLVLLGDPDAPSPAEGMKKLWESDPENPAYFAEYARECLKSSKALPPIFRRSRHDSIPTMATF
jgi:hypothetical protein